MGNGDFFLEKLKKRKIVEKKGLCLPQCALTISIFITFGWQWINLFLQLSFIIVEKRNGFQTLKSI